jgi:hypothetical protein
VLARLVKAGRRAGGSGRRVSAQSRKAQTKGESRRLRCIGILTRRQPLRVGDTRPVGALAALSLICSALEDEQVAMPELTIVKVQKILYGNC